MRRLARQGYVATTRLTAVEIASALARRRREGHITADDHVRVLTALEVDFRELYVVELTPAVEQRARRLLDRHALRASDAVQLASCIELKEALSYDVGFAAFDRRLINAAESEALTITARGHADA